jgi:hypothetical protein
VRLPILALLCHAGAIAATPGPPVVTEPVVVRGYVEVAGDEELDSGILLSTPTDEFVIAMNAAGREIARLAGDEIEVHGSLVEHGGGAPTLVARTYHAIGSSGRR